MLLCCCEDAGQVVKVDSDHDQTVRRCNAVHRSASLFLIGLDLGGSPAGYSDDCLANSPKLKVLCMMRLAGGEEGSIPSRGSFYVSPYAARG